MLPGQQAVGVEDTPVLIRFPALMSPGNAGFETKLGTYLDHSAKWSCQVVFSYHKGFYWI